MEKRISSCSIVSLLLCFCTLLPLQAQTMSGGSGQRNGNNRQQKKEKKEPEIIYPLYNGVNVGVDLWGVGAHLLGSDFLSSEVAVDVDLKHRYFPVVELGFGKAEGENDFGTTYKSGMAPYFRIGMDYNALYHKKHGHQLRVGLRYAVSSFKYDVRSGGELEEGLPTGNPQLEDEIWGGSLPFDQTGMKGSMQWLEFCVGLRAKVTKSISMGWSARFKFKLSNSSDEYGDPWYVPGFGKYGSNTLGISYHIVYKLPL